VIWEQLTRIDGLDRFRARWMVLELVNSEVEFLHPLASTREYPPEVREKG
jgi:hypothetical protein